MSHNRREPKPFFRKQNQSWYVELNGKQKNIGKYKEAEFKQYHEIMAGRQELTPDITAAELLDRFLAWCKNNKAARTYEFHLRPLQSFVDRIGRSIRVSDYQTHDDELERAVMPLARQVVLKKRR